MSEPKIAGLWLVWLLVACTGGALFGLGLIFLPTETGTLFSFLYLGAADAHLEFGETGVRYVAFAFGVLGAVMVGWMALMVGIILGPFRRCEPWSWNILAGPLVIWFILDTGHSIASGFWQNAIVNVAFLVSFMVPLMATRRHFQPS